MGDDPRGTTMGELAAAFERLREQAGSDWAALADEGQILGLADEVGALGAAADLLERRLRREVSERRATRLAETLADRHGWFEVNYGAPHAFSAMDTVNARSLCGQTARLSYLRASDPSGRYFQPVAGA